MSQEILLLQWKAKISAIDYTYPSWRKSSLELKLCYFANSPIKHLLNQNSVQLIDFCKDSTTPNLCDTRSIGFHMLNYCLWHQLVIKATTRLQARLTGNLLFQNVSFGSMSPLIHAVNIWSQSSSQLIVPINGHAALPFLLCSFSKCPVGISAVGYFLFRRWPAGR